ncbi:MAG: eukaryotic translation initiation factor EIF4E family protein [Crocinitomicaceae bacterium]|nr:eukaryotic translation initiation factor EIF4E family protein [Crocinitomicaceae bacterium]
MESPESTKFKQCWVLWYFDPRNKDWSLSNYKKVADIMTPQQFWSVIGGIPKEAWECGYFFFMRRGFRPIWEVPENEHGGSWSKKVSTKEIYDTAIDLMVHSVTDELLNDKKDIYVGFSTSPKGDFNIIKIWNNTTAITSRLLLNNKMILKITDDVVYTAHKSRK